MYFRSRKKLQGEVSLSDTIEGDAAGSALSLMDVVGCDDTMLSDMADREERLRIRELVDRCLTDREAEVIRRRYGLSGRLPQTQRQVAAAFGISRSYVSRRAYCKCPERLGLILKIVFAAKNDRPIKNSACPYFSYKKFQYLAIFVKILPFLL
jgi:RNA polymerase sporulation-specific sigma factor